MKDGGVMNKKKAWILVGVVVVVILIAVAVVVIAINMRRSEPGDVGGAEYTLPEELMGDDLSLVDQVTKETSLMLNNSDASNDEIEAYYDETINKAVVDGDTDSAVRIVIQKMDFLAVIEENCDKAAEYIDNVDLAPYSAEEKRYLASYVVSMAGSCGNEDLQDKWRGIMKEGVVEE